MRPAYNILFFILFWISAPFYFLKMWRRGNWSADFGQRFGRFGTRIKQAVTNRHVIWLHAVSVGEVAICARLIQALERRLPNVKFVVSTTTSTGMGELQRQLAQHIEKIYYPIDFKPWVRSALLTVHPKAIILVEAEIWPNFLWRVTDLDLPVFLVNARLSEKSFRGYQRFRRLFQPLFAAFTAVGCQNEEDARRLIQLGVRPDRVFPHGSMKFDAGKPDERRSLDVRALLRRAGVPDQALLLIGGSTHAGEEEVLIDVYRHLKPRHPDLFLILVPRHFERTREVIQLLDDRGLESICRTDVDHAHPDPSRPLDCLLVNTTGELRHFYREAEIVFVGKSLTAHGGQNPIEPAALGKATIFGPNMQNFSDIVRLFINGGGAVQVTDAPELEREIEHLLTDRDYRDALGRKGLAVVEANSGALGRTVEMIVEQLSAGELYITPKSA